MEMFPADCLAQVLVLLLPLNLCSVLDLLLVVKAELNNRMAACCWAQLARHSQPEQMVVLLGLERQSLSLSSKGKLAYGWRPTEVFSLLAFCFLLVFPHRKRFWHESVRSNTKTSKTIDNHHNRNLNLNISIKSKQTWDFFFFWQMYPFTYCMFVYSPTSQGSAWSFQICSTLGWTLSFFKVKQV